MKNAITQIATLIVLLNLITGFTSAQYTLTLTGRSNNGGFVQLHHAIVEDLTQGWADTLYYPDTVLLLSGVGIPSHDGCVPAFALYPNTPNPFDGVTDFTFILPYEDGVTVEVFDMTGRRVTATTQRLPAGEHLFRVWLTRPQQYVLTVRTSKESASIKMVNNGHGTSDRISRHGMQPLTFKLRSESSGGYEPGDLLRIVGYRQAGDNFLPSDTVEITTLPNGLLPLTFTIENEVPMMQEFTSSGRLFIPDGTECNGSCIGTMDILVDGYDPQAILLDMAQLPYVRLKMEHSYLGDLWITLACPNGLTANILRKYTSGNSDCSSLIPTADWGWPTISGTVSPVSYFGLYNKTDASNSSPCDTSLNPMGECWNYCWSDDTEQGQTYACGSARVYEVCNHVTADNPYTSGSGSSASQYVDSTDVSTLTNVYHPDQPFTSLIGCPLNGVWQIRVIDGWRVDNGYIEEAAIALLDTVSIPMDVPYVSTGFASSVTQTTAECSGHVYSEGAAPVTVRGICWSTTPSPVASGNHAAAGSGLGAFSATITNLSPSTGYYYRAYAINALGTSYGEQKYFTTSPCAQPTVTTTPANAVTDNSAEVGGVVISDGCTPVVEQGVCWSVSGTPTANGTHVTAPLTASSFSCLLTGLAPATTYNARAYASTAAGTSYGETISFTTGFAMPAVSSDSITMVGSSYATCHGTLLYDGGDPATVVGFCWSEASPTPTISDNHVEVGSNLGTFSHTVSGIQGTVCHVRAYASNANGIVYGNTLTFYPAIMPTTVSLHRQLLDYDSAVFRVTIVCDSVAAITARGLCVGAQPMPNLLGQTIAASGNDNTFDIVLNDLPRATAYHLRGYCIDGGTTIYSDDLLLLTPAEDGHPCMGDSTITDFEGHVYNTVQVGGQCWMRSNLYTTHFTDGTAIEYGNTGAGLYSSYTPYYYKLTYDNSLTSTYGYAYNWKALTKLSTTTNVDAQGICPDGWHIPDENEFARLGDYVGMHYACGENTASVAKALASETGWNASTANCSPGATPTNNNLTGFSAYPAGGHYNYSFNQGEQAHLWSRSVYYTFDSSPYYSYAFVYKISYNGQTLSRNSYSYDRAFPVRCVRND